MKKLLLIYLASITVFSLAQDYQTIISNQQNYFAVSNKSQILATRTDSVLMQGQDSVFYSFKTFRPNDSFGTNNCDYIISYPWYGAKVVIKPNGENQFFNRSLDTIHIQTQAILNDTFLVYTYPSGHEIKGAVISHDTSTVLGVLDSIKTVQLFSNDTVFTYQDSLLAFGKNAGFTKVLPFYSFPQEYFNTNYHSHSLALVGTEYPRTGITKRTVGEIYDLEIGDVIQTYRNTIHWQGPYSENQKDKYVVTNKNIWGTDSVQLVYDKSWIHVINYNSQTQYSSNNTTSSSKGFNLDEYLNPYLPEEFIIDSSNGNIQFYQVNLKATYCDRITESIQPIIVMFETDSLGNTLYNSGCYFHIGFGVTFPMPNEYVEAAGGPYQLNGLTYWNGFGQTHFGGISYMSNSIETCGTEWFLGQSSEELSGISIYPNPANSAFNIALENNESLLLELYNISGQLVYTTTLSSSLTVIDIADLRSGVYLIKLIGEESGFQQKLIVD